MAVSKTGLIGVVAGLIIGAAIFIYVASTLLTDLMVNNTATLFSSITSASTTEWNMSIVNQSTAYNTSVNAMITVSFTVGSLMAIAAVAVVGFWIVRNVIGGQ